ncbi:MAG: class I SAM-dependent methyltransferase [Desulfuromonas sp.]|nr:MAG: class I SAM-dependent methyltransferase [Desulfuromonas sp.]
MDTKKFNPKKLAKLNDPQRLIDISPEFIASKLSLQAPDILVDIGAGTALFSVAFHERCKAETTYACDLSVSMIDWMTENISPQHPDIIPVKTEESAIPLADSLANLTFMINLHHELDDPTAVLNEAHRLLKPGGEIFIVDWKKEEMPQGPPVEIRFLPEQVESQLENAGFSAIRSFNDLPKDFLVIGVKNEHST